MLASTVFRYGLWTAVLGTALRNRKEYGVPTAWLTHLAGNSVTLFLPDALRALAPLHDQLPSALHPFVRTITRRVADDPLYAVYAAPLALGFIASHPDYSIYHGRWAERTIFGFGADSIPHSTAAYGLARLTSEMVLTLHDELPREHPLAQPAALAAQHVDTLAALAVAAVTLLWEVAEYRAHYAEVEATGRDPSEVNMQWSLPDSITDSIANVAGLAVAIAVRRNQHKPMQAAVESALGRTVHANM